MLLKTHLAIVVFFILLLIPSVEHKLVFVLVALIATYIPDIDSREIFASDCVFEVKLDIVIDT